MKLLPILESVLSVDKVYENIETLMGEDYPPSFNMGEFKQLTSFDARTRYCATHLKRISSGTSRIVYKIDDEKVLKLAYNKKGLAQNETEIGYSKEEMLSDLVARVYAYDQNYKWSEMELARKVNKPTFKNITGLDWDVFVRVVDNYGKTYNNNSRKPHHETKEESEMVWENNFAYDVLQYIGNYSASSGDLCRLNSYGVVKRGGIDAIVLIDYGLNDDVYDSYYS